jgi:hypothetical protein
MAPATRRRGHNAGSPPTEEVALAAATVEKKTTARQGVTLTAQSRASRAGEQGTRRGCATDNPNRVSAKKSAPPHLTLFYQ